MGVSIMSLILGRDRETTAHRKITKGHRYSS